MILIMHDDNKHLGIDETNKEEKYFNLVWVS